MGFLDGIQTSINEPTDLDSVTSDTEISLDIDFEKLFFNMLKAEADYLYTLEEWDGIFSEVLEQLLKVRRLVETTLAHAAAARNISIAAARMHKFLLTFDINH